ncbi:MAG TPA: site-specific integrase [Puia sp.]|nr:site-specific integrase [Puia sp.]
MSTKSFGVLFYLKSRRIQTYEEGEVYLRITVNKARQDLSLQRRCLPELWSKEAGRAIGKRDSARALNAYLDTIEAKVHEARHRLLTLGKPVTVQYIRDIVRGKEPEFEKVHTLLEIFQHHNDQMAKLVGSEYAEGTLVRFKTAWRHTRDYIQWKYKADDINIQHLNYEFASEFEFWLKSVKKCAHNTSIKYIACCKKVVIHCMRNGWLNTDPFLGFNMALREVDREALTEEELNAIAVHSFITDRLTHVRDIFLFSCYTGLAYSDIRKLKRTEISTGVDGEKWIFTKRKKTETPSRIPLLPAALDILQQYEHHPSCTNKSRVLPILSNQKMNAYLKEIADVCKIHKNLTFHIARHTFATTVTLSNGVPIETVSKLLGHRNLKTTQHYAKILDVKVSQDMKALKEKLKEKQ